MSIKRLIPGVLVALMSATAAHGAEYSFHPSIAASEEYTDNVFDTNNKVSDYITRVLPGIALSMKSPLLEGDLNYTFDYRYYARKNHDNESTHVISANARLNLIKDFFTIDMNDDYRRVSLDITRDVTKESLFANQTDRNTASVSPTFVLHPLKTVKLKTGYRFIDTRYLNSIGINKQDHVAFLDGSYELNSRWSVTFGYSFTRENSVLNNFNQHQAYGGFRYEYADKSFLFAQGGNTWIAYMGGQRFNNPYWNAGLNHTFDLVTATLNTGIRYDEDPLGNISKELFAGGSLERSLKKGTVGLSLNYSEYAATDTNTLQTRKYSGTVHWNNEFMERLTGNLAFTAEKYEQLLLHSYTRRFAVEAGLSYLVTKLLTASLNYYFIDYYSPGIATDNRQVNRCICELKMTF